MIGAARCDDVKISQVVEDPIVEQVPRGVEPVHDTAVRTLFAILAIEKPTVNPARGRGGNT
jgi:hypothetical protein